MFELQRYIEIFSYLFKIFLLYNIYIILVLSNLKLIFNKKFKYTDTIQIIFKLPILLLPFFSLLKRLKFEKVLEKKM